MRAAFYRSSEPADPCVGRMTGPGAGSRKNRFVETCSWEPNAGRPRLRVASFSQLRLFENSFVVSVTWFVLQEILCGPIFRILGCCGLSLSAFQQYGGFTGFATAKTKRKRA
jgi:hypothetical protein